MIEPTETLNKTQIKVAIMQPYFFPYIGYWQLINCVDIYVIFDDVNFINRGWIDRNRIIINDEIKYINLPVISKSQNKLINEILINKDENLTNKLLKKIELAYKRAPHFNDAFSLVEKIIKNKERNLAFFLKDSINAINKYLDINTKIMMSSELNNNKEYKAKYKIIDICKLLGADVYINAIGGKQLYIKDDFISSGIKLLFLRPNCIKYCKNNNKFEPNLSIIDLLMHCSKDEIKKYLLEYELVD